ncbi:MAG: site-specific integrase [Herminiimonas sp.]|uniref:site-specific integrase n=1 Tax=Herminiimonas sp. TaxID=1926289 RepID=UPI002719DAE7|nr:site-specific integrase [Herminiimonas sp.]MDO9421065.1 site-specific integrase [Herminiimonas sp.]
MDQHPADSSSELACAKDILGKFCAALPLLPSVLRYRDEFSDTIHSIRHPEEKSSFELMVHGDSRTLDFSKLDSDCALIFKHVFAFLIVQNLSIGTAYNYIFYAHQFTPADVALILEAQPSGIANVWKNLRGRELQPQAYKAAKSLLYLLCAYRLYGWSNDYHVFLSTTLPLPVVDKYAAVRAGDVFLSTDEEAVIVRYIDEIAQQPGIVSYNTLVNTGMLICAYQFAMRPFQIGMLDQRHVRIWNDEISNETTVHLSFHMAKQRGGKNRILLTRRVKREWVPIFTLLKTKLELSGTDGTTKFFQAKSSMEVGNRISTFVRNLIDSDDIGTATDLRHTAAQRLVDAGASHEELAEFMGHAQTDTGLVYYATSASHAERVNRALGASEVYRRVEKIAHDKFISNEELTQLKEEQQIAAVPHGISIAGIGGCQSGQPSCPYNPITSCYGCHKFMPVRDIVLHEKVLDNIREIVLFFERSSRADVKSPAYMQLQRTIAEIQVVIDEIEKNSR